jgi:hypothetical protein
MPCHAWRLVICRQQSFGQLSSQRPRTTQDEEALALIRHAIALDRSIECNGDRVPELQEALQFLTEMTQA